MDRYEAVMTVKEAKTITIEDNSLLDLTGSTAGTVYRRTKKGWLARHWDSNNPNDVYEFITDSFLVKMLSSCTFTQEYPLKVDGFIWVENNVGVKYIGNKRIRRADIKRESQGWNDKLATDVARLLNNARRVSMQREYLGWYHEYTMIAADQWRYRRYNDGDIEIERIVSYAEVFHWLYDAYHDYSHIDHSYEYIGISFDGTDIDMVEPKESSFLRDYIVPIR